MSLICGIVSRQDKSLASPSALAAILSASPHRASDGQRTFVEQDAGIALGYSHTATFGNDGEPPAWHEDDQVVAAIDGDIYEAKARPDAGAFENPHAGAVLSSFKEKGDAFCYGLDGFFAFFLWDRRRATLHLCNDPMTRKLLYYYHDPARELLVYSTELKGVLAHPAVPRELDRRVIPHYLGRTTVEPPLTLLRGLRKLCAGQHLSFSPGAVDSERYLRPIVVTGPADFGFWRDRLRTQLLQGVELILGGVPRVGVFLSGGMDSSNVLAAVSTNAGSEVRAFTLTYGDADHQDDVVWAGRVARQTHTQQEIVVVDAESVVTPEVLSAVMRQFDEPFQSSSRAWNEYFLCKTASELGFRSVLNGEITGYGVLSAPSASEEPAPALSWDEAVGGAQSRLRGFSAERIEKALGFKPDLAVLQEPWLANREVLEGLEASRAIALARLLNAAAGKGHLFHQYVAPLFGVDERSLFTDTGTVLLDISQPGAYTGVEASTTAKALFQ